MTATIQPNPKILTSIVSRASARAKARDLEGLRAILAAAEEGRDLAAQALADALAAMETPAKPPKSTPVREARPAKLPADRPRKLPEPKPPEEERYERKVVQQHVSKETSEFFAYVKSMGGVRPSSPDLQPEYAENIPPSYRRPDGMPGDELAEQMSVDRPEYGIASENELLEFFGARRRMARHERALATA